MSRLSPRHEIQTQLWNRQFSAVFMVGLFLLLCVFTGLIFPEASQAGDSVSREDVRRQLRLVYNHPNPFNPSTTIDYVLLESAKVRVCVYDLKGRLVEELVNEHQNEGPNFAVWKTQTAPSGTYIFSLDANGVRVFRKMSLVR